MDKKKQIKLIRKANREVDQELVRKHGDAFKLPTGSIHQDKRKKPQKYKKDYSNED